jgi:hypothetical protein
VTGLGWLGLAPKIIKIEKNKNKNKKIGEIKK